MKALRAKLFPLKTTGCVISQSRVSLHTRLSVAEIRGHWCCPQILTCVGREDLGEFPLLIAFEKKVAVFRACPSSLKEGRHKEGRVFACSKSCQMAKK